MHVHPPCVARVWNERKSRSWAEVNEASIMCAIVILGALVATILGRVTCLKLNRGNDAFSLQIEQKTVVGLYNNLNMIIRNVQDDVLSMTPSQAGFILESIEVKRLQTSIDRWTIIVSKIQSDIHAYSSINQQIYHEMQINIAVSNVLLGYLNVLNESLIIGMGKLATSCPIIWNIGSHFNESIDASMSWLYCVIPYGSMNPTYYPESMHLESIVDERLPWIKYAYTNTGNHNSTVALLFESLQVEPKMVNFIANETRNTWLFMLKLRLKLISYALKILESKSKNQKLKIYNSVEHMFDGDILLYDNQISDSMQNYYALNDMICNSTQYSNDASDSCSNSKFHANMIVLFMSSLIDALKSEIQVETVYYLDFMNVTINQGISTIVDDYSHQQQIAASNIATPMGFQSRANVLAIFTELVVYWQSDQKKTHYTTTSHATGAGASGDNSKNHKEGNKDELRGGYGALLTSQLVILAIVLASGGACYKYLVISKATAASSATSKASSKSTKSVKSTNKMLEHKIKKKGNKSSRSPAKKHVAQATSPAVDCTHSPPESRESNMVKLVSESVSTDELQLCYSDNDEEWQVSSKKKCKPVIQPRNESSNGKFVKPKRENSSKTYDTTSRSSNEQQPKHIAGRSTKDGSVLLKQALSIRPVSATNSNKANVLPQNAEKKSNNVVNRDSRNNQVNNDANESLDDTVYTEAVDERQYSSDVYPPIPAIIAPQYNPYYYYNNAMSPPLGPSTSPQMIFYNPYTEHMGQVLPLSPPPIPVLPRSPVGNGYPIYNDVDILTLVRNQIEYYFSDENLTKDTYLRSLMDGNGYVNIGEIIKFRRINILLQCVGGSPLVVRDAVLTSEKLELSGLNTDSNILEINENQILTYKIRSKIF